jgi:hypothetical protein
MLKNDDDLAKIEIVKADGQLCKPQSKALLQTFFECHVLQIF